MTALARRLEQRGHTVVIFGIADVEERVKAAGVEFCRIGESDYPPGTLLQLDRRLGELKGLATFRFTVERVKNTTVMGRRGDYACRTEHCAGVLGSRCATRVHPAG
jgi:zeaxanthin glucosyltransferase